MPTILAQIAPQRSTQYSDLAKALAPHELVLSGLVAPDAAVERIALGGQSYLRFDIPELPDSHTARELGMLAMSSAFFVYREHIGEAKGPFLQPVETGFHPTLPLTMLVARRYRGKTNELFTRFLCNVARFSSALSHRPWETLRVFDPLAGGGTTLFTALVMGASAAGVERRTTDVESTVVFIRNYCHEQGIACRIRKERLRGIGHRWICTLGKHTRQTCLLAAGDTADSHDLISGFRPHLIVGDLPYGVQHRAKLTDLLARSVPVWASLLPLAGSLVLAWESRRFPREEMIALIEETSSLKVLNHPPYNALSHRVDRVIKERDIVVTRLAEALKRGYEPADPA